jgi:nitroreductase
MEPIHPVDSLLATRRSCPARLLAEPGPDREQLRRLIASAVRVPDHGRLTPWRFVAIQGESRRSLAERLAVRCLESGPGGGDAAVEKVRQRFSASPVIIALVARITAGHKVPEQEQLLSGGAVGFALLLAAHEMGFAAQWLTGWPAYDPVVAQWLGLAGTERVLGFIHVGTATEPVPERQRPDPDQLLSFLAP